MADRQELELIIKAKQQTDAAFAAVMRNLAETTKGTKGATAGTKLLGAATGELQGRLGSLSGSAGAAGTILTALGPAGIAAGAGIGIAATAVYTLLGWTKEFAAGADNLINTASQISFSAEALQEWTFAAEDVGGAQATVTASA